MIGKQCVDAGAPWGSDGFTIFNSLNHLLSDAITSPLLYYRCAWQVRSTLESFAPGLRGRSPGTFAAWAEDVGAHCVAQ